MSRPSHEMFIGTHCVSMRALAIDSGRPSIMIAGVRRARLSLRGETTLRLPRKCLFRRAKIESLSGCL
jgi:hypothetical protein